METRKAITGSVVVEANPVVSGATAAAAFSIWPEKIVLAAKAYQHNRLEGSSGLALARPSMASSSARSR
jgi:hypothetical protein